MHKTVGELIKILQAYNKDLPVFFGYDGGYYPIDLDEITSMCVTAYNPVSGFHHDINTIPENIRIKNKRVLVVTNWG